MKYEGLRLKVLKLFRVKLSKFRSKKLKNRSFTIISNNCWGGMIYESYGLIKQSPTVGLFFMAEDYIKFISDLKTNTSSEIRFIKPEMSKWYEEVKGDHRFGSYPVGVISNDIEIFFLHYHSEKEAAEKWRRRCKRINWSRMIVKFNDQNGCNAGHIEAFQSMNYANKIFFTIKDWSVSNQKGIIKIKQPFEKRHIMASYEPFGASHFFNVTEYINHLTEVNI